MLTRTLQAHVGADGVLRVEVPTGMTHVDLEVVVTFHPLKEQVITQETSRQHWPTGFIEQVFGGWQGKPLERAPQGEYEVRRTLE
jgi:hypothetical protein